MVGIYNPTETYSVPTWDNEWRPGADFTFIGGSDWRVDISDADLQGNSALHTAIVMLLFTDKRAPEDAQLPTTGSDRRGWWGDFVDVRARDGETEMGSLLWLRERSTLTDNSEREIQTDVEIALDPLLDQGIAADIRVSVAVDKIAGSALISVQVFSQSGELRYNQRFYRIWTQTHPELG